MSQPDPPPPTPATPAMQVTSNPLAPAAEPVPAAEPIELPSRRPFMQGLLEKTEQGYEFAVWLLRFLEVAVVGGLMLGVAHAAYLWWAPGGLTLPVMMEEFAGHWQGGVVVVLVLLIPTIRDLVERLKTLPGGTEIRPKEPRHVPRPDRAATPGDET